jgi:hypothetical protein
LYHCPATCSGFVASNPDSFVDAYWEFKSFKVYRAFYSKSIQPCHLANSKRRTKEIPSLQTFMQAQ